MTDFSTDPDLADARISKVPIFRDSSIDCAICLEPLNDRRVITLGCGHRWHYDCLVQQLRTAQPSSTKRLLFTGCQCAKCAVICEHSELKDLTRSTDALRQKVNQLVLDQVILDVPELWKRCKDEPTARILVLEDAQRKYAFYMCSHCKEPYFGGTVECADQEETEEERLCVACSPQSQVCCQNPQEHGGYLIWKCRYCCKPSTHLCYGSIHFCDDCHDRNSVRVQEQQRQRTMTTGRNSVSHPPPQEASPCSGNSCPFPKPDNQTHHSNGSRKDSEQVYGCAWCQSTSNRQQEHVEEPGSHNLLTNPSGQVRLRGWRQLNPQISWRVEQSDLPVNATTTTNFVSSFQPCVMSQVLDLSKILQSHCTVRLEISARYMGRTDCPSVFCLKAVLMDRNKLILQRLATEPLQAPPDFWDRASLIFDGASLPQARYLNITVIGRDSRFWQGNFGSKVADCSIRVLGSPEQLAQVMRQAPRLLPARGPGVPNDTILQRQGFTIRRGTFLPMVGFAILAWLLAKLEFS